MVPQILGVQAIHRRGGRPTAAGAPPSRSLWRLIRVGFIVGASNPKSIVFFVAVLPQFVAYSGGSIPLQLTTADLHLGCHGRGHDDRARRNPGAHRHQVLGQRDQERPRRQPAGSQSTCESES
ncbi:hypothetical protein J2S92_003087 [Arthrobacter bambusae]|nr:hypothetical protein [Arthrobacter bambusae]